MFPRASSGSELTIATALKSTSLQSEDGTANLGLTPGNVEHVVDRRHVRHVAVPRGVIEGVECHVDCPDVIPGHRTMAVYRQQHRDSRQVSDY